MNNIPTPEEWLKNHKELSENDVALYDEDGYAGVDNKALYTIMEEYGKLMAKFHVEAALKAASEEKTHGMLVVPMFNEEQQKAILNAYPKENIK